MNNKINNNEGSDSGGINLDANTSHRMNESNGETEETVSGQERMQEIMGKARVYLNQHWKTAAMILGVGILARLFMNKRKS